MSTVNTPGGGHHPVDNGLKPGTPPRHPSGAPAALVKPYGCHNRAPIVTVCKPTCQYTHTALGQADPRCNGCHERYTPVEVRHKSWCDATGFWGLLVKCDCGASEAAAAEIGKAMP